MKNFKNNHRRNRYRKNGIKNMHQKDNGHNTMADFTNNSNFRPRNQWKNNQNASKLIDKYTNLAREALSNGDKILSENYFQHADHFSRILRNEQLIKNGSGENQINLTNENKDIVKDQPENSIQTKTQES